MTSPTISLGDVLGVMTDEEREEVLRPDFKIPLELFLRGFNQNPDLPRSAVLDKFKNYARRRRGVKNAITRNPEILKNNINSPIIIIGLPRTGTTFLYRMLLSDPQFIAPMYWEMVEPVPPGRPDDWKECDRLKKAAQDPELAAFASGALDKGHYVRLETAYECFMILRHFFIDFVDPWTNDKMVELREFLCNPPEGHMTSTYEFYKMFLQCLFYGNLRQGMTLMVKCPIHVLYLDALHRVFPDAKFIFPYRNAKTMVASESSLIKEVAKVMGKAADHAAVGARTAWFYKLGSARAVRFLKKLPEESYITLPYTEMINKPLEAVKEIYSHFNLNLTAETVQNLQKYVKENPQHKHGKVEYTPEEFGITDESIQEDMKEYIQYFADGPEKL